MSGKFLSRFKDGRQIYQIGIRCQHLFWLRDHSQRSSRTIEELVSPAKVLGESDLVVLTKL